MKRIQTTINVLLLAAAVLLLGGLPSASAYDQGYDSTRAASITIVLPDLGTERNGVPFTCYRVGVPEEGNGLRWELIPELSHVSVDLSGTLSARESQQAALELEAALAGLDVTDFMGTTDETGVVVFSDLPQGVYLVVQTQTKDYGTVAPFLVAAPYADENEWVYEVVTEPKAESLETPTEEPPSEPEKETEEPESDHKAPSDVKTGDTTNWMGYAAIFVAAAAVVLLLLVKGFKKNRKDN